MQIIIAHSHLNPGGVTRIIESQIESLPNDSIKVLVGNCQNPEFIVTKGAKLKIFEPLNYLEIKKHTKEEIHEGLENILQFLKKEVNENSILHFHNLNLGKNPIVTYAVYLMAKEGINIFNHAHDFAEDRPVNYNFLKEIIEGNFGENLSKILYPDFSNYHFGVLNKFDFERLQKYGIQKERIEWLPNPVSFNIHENISDKEGAKDEVCQALKLDKNKLLVTYPVRVIRRKNIGELILLSVLFSDKVNFVVTQPPKNPLEIEWYKKWLSFCEVENIQMTFEAGNKVDFEKLLIVSDFCITTSYREGFGMVYLEPWLLNTPVIGRDIDYITHDFINDGFLFSALYQELNVPGFDSDFKNLEIEKQMDIIHEVKNSAVKREKIFEQNEGLKSLFEKVKPETIEKNKNIIKNNYSLKGYGIKLKNRYKKLVG